MPRSDLEAEYVPCPQCGHHTLFQSHGKITVNCESKQEIVIPQLYEQTNPCDNPFCKWNKLK